MRDINKIIVHCSATRPEQTIGASEIRKWHKERGWRDIGYHYVIRRSGILESGRSESEVGAHVKGHNDDSIGICLIGGINDNGAPDANYSYDQYVTLYRLLCELLDRYKSATLHGHYEFSSKACPCFDVRAFYYG